MAQESDTIEKAARLADHAAAQEHALRMMAQDSSPLSNLCRAYLSQAAEIARLTAALEQAGKWFREYEAHHLMKNPPDTDKGYRNNQRAEACEVALSHPHLGDSDHD